MIPRNSLRYALRVAAVASVAALCCGSLSAQEPDGANSTQDAPTAVEKDERPAEAHPFPDRIKLPDGILDGGSEWLNTAGPISLKDLRGKIVLLDFWTYCCINCMHVLPDLKALEEKYGRQIVVIGVHSAKFDNEKDSENIRNAIMRYEIAHPVVNDSEMLIWRKFGTRAWPTLTLIDPEGNYIGSQGGEGNLELFDAVISKLVEYHRRDGTLDETPLVFDLETRRQQDTPLRYPGKVLADAEGQRLFISDSNHNRIVIASLDGTFQESIGSGRIGFTDGTFAEATFDHPQGMELVGDQLYIADTENHALRVADLTAKTVSTLAGTGRQGRPGVISGRPLEISLNSPWDLKHLNGRLFIAMAGPHQIWSHDLGSDMIGVFAGTAREDVINGPHDASAFAQPSGFALSDDGAYLYVADSEGSAIRQVETADDGQTTTLAGTSELPRGQSLFAFGDKDGIGAEARLQHPLGVAFDDGIVYVADAYNHKIRKIDTATSEVTTWLGDGKASSTVDPPGLSEPSGLSISGRRLFIADTNNHRIAVADLDDGTFSVLPIKGLTSPASTAAEASGAMDTEITDVDAVTVPIGDSVGIRVTLALPEGYKRNALAPFVWEVTGDDAAGLIPEDAIGERDEAETVDDSSAVIRLPLKGEPGSAELTLRISYGYCRSEKAGLCRLATAAFRIPLTVAEDAETQEIELVVPESSVRTGEE